MLKGFCTYRGAVVSAIIPKAYSLSKLGFQLLPLSLLIGTPGAAKRVIVDDTDPRTQYSGSGAEEWSTDLDRFGLNKAQLLYGTAH